MCSPTPHAKSSIVLPLAVRTIINPAVEDRLVHSVRSRPTKSLTRKLADGKLSSTRVPEFGFDEPELSVKVADS